MNFKRILVVCVILSLGIFLMAGCKSTPKGIKGPEWVWKGSGAFDVEKGKVFYGVGFCDISPGTIVGG